MHAVLRKSLNVRVALRDQTQGRTNRWPQWIPRFEGKEVGINEFITDVDLEGKSTALLFMDSAPKLLPAMFADSKHIASLLSEASTDRSLYVLVGTRDHEQSLAVDEFRRNLHERGFRGARLIYDRDYTIARRFLIRQFPTMVLADPEGRISRIWSGPSVCRRDGKKLVHSSPVYRDAELARTADSE